MNFDNKKIMPRFKVLVIVMALFGLYILGNAAYLMFAERDYWTEVSKKFVKENVPIPAKRGNVFSADGQLMASTLPEYKIFMDFVAYDRNPEERAKLQHWRDTMLLNNIDSIAVGLNKIFPDKSAKEFKAHLLKGKKHKRRNWLVYPKRISYIQYKECKKLPLFKERPFKGGFYYEEFKLRKKPYGSLATRTLGDLYAGKDSAKNGLELAFDTVLRGKPGISHRSKVRNKWLDIVDVQPEDGCDVIATIDVAMQDASEKALVKQLKNIGADVGVVVLMEVATGDVKAIVNMKKGDDGEYYEVMNNAIADLMEPGSTFKTASIMVALEDGKITKNDFIETGNGQWPMHGRVMKDHNWHRGGYGTISVPEVLMYSSNVGVSRIIDENYTDCPEKYVEGLYRMGVGMPLDLPLAGSANPRVKHPIKNKNLWWKTSLAWMSIGYETQLPPIATLTFYNAIANDGKMVKPRFVTAVKKNGEVLYEYPVEVLKERICSPSTLADIREILEMVVSKGLGKKAGCKDFKVSGKTGTAQVAQKGGGYKSGRTNYLISFCGFYPSEQPKYSCIVAIQKTGLPASGGGHCGPVFSEIAQSVMAKGVYRDVSEASDSTSVFVPDVLYGNMNAAQYVLEELDIPYRSNQDESSSVWGVTENNGNAVKFTVDDTPMDVVPDVRGMGAKDAVYALESRGLKVTLEGMGKVVGQSIAPDSDFQEGETIHIRLK